MQIYQQQDYTNSIRCNFVRFIQLMICASGTVLVTINFRYETLSLLAVHVALLVTGGSFTLITFVDVLARTGMLLSIHFKLWLLYAFTGSVMMLMSVLVFVIVVDLEKEVMTPLMLSCFFVGSVSFLWDAVCILFFRKYRVVPLTPDTVSDRVIVIKQPPSTPNPDTYLGMVEAAEPAATSNTSSNMSSPLKSLRRDELGNEVKNQSLQRARPSKKPQKAIVSYGGTFHVSKNAVPLPSPSNYTVIKTMNSESRLSVISEHSDQTKSLETETKLEDYLFQPTYN